MADTRSTTSKKGTNLKTTEELLYDFMLDISSREPTPLEQIKRKVLILSTPRCGSTLFCDVLNNHALLGECSEWFNMRYMHAYAKVKQLSNIDFSDYFRFIAARTLRGSDTFVVNMHIDQHRSLIQKNINPLTLKFDHIFYLQRRNKLRQAVSLAKASLTDRWAADSKSDSDDSQSPSNALVAQALASLLVDEEYYNVNLRNLVSHEFAYEEFQDVPNSGVFKQLFEVLGSDSPAILGTDMTRQANQKTNDLVTGFLNYIQEGNNPI